MHKLETKSSAIEIDLLSLRTRTGCKELEECVDVDSLKNVVDKKNEPI